MPEGVVSVQSAFQPLMPLGIRAQGGGVLSATAAPSFHATTPNGFDDLFEGAQRMPAVDVLTDTRQFGSSQALQRAERAFRDNGSGKQLFWGVMAVTDPLFEESDTVFNEVVGNRGGEPLPRSLLKEMPRLPSGPEIYIDPEFGPNAHYINETRQFFQPGAKL